MHDTYIKFNLNVLVVASSCLLELEVIQTYTRVNEHGMVVRELELYYSYLSGLVCGITRLICD
jgi:hypothetical protein